MAPTLPRRDFLAASLATLATASLGRAAEDDIASQSESLVPIRPLTRGPKHHWFAYYDKLQFDPTNRLVLCNEVAFEGRSPTGDDSIGVGLVDLGDNDRWTPLGTSSAWGWQQGCMLQWRPGSESEVVWNDRQGDRFVCHVLNVKTGEKRTLPRPVYALSPDGRWAVTTDFARLQTMRPGYGYAGLADKYASEKAPAKSGIWRMDLDSGESELIVSLADLAARPYRGKTLGDQWNWFNHLLVSPDGERFIFLHRWRSGTSGGFTTRLFTARSDGSDLHETDPSGNTSHFIWRDPEHICAWTRPDGQPNGFYLFRDKTDQVEPVGRGVMTLNGHNTYVPATDNAWILNDTYPDRQRRQTPYLFHVPTGRRQDLGHFHSPPEYTGEWRCDTHPRSSNDGRLVTIDSPHGGSGRQLWLLEVGAILDG
jgi:hypothetical protein